MNTLQEFKEYNLKKYQAINLDTLGDSYPLNSISKLIERASDPAKETIASDWTHTPSDEFYDIVLNGDEVSYPQISGVKINKLENAWTEFQSDKSVDALGLLHHSNLDFGLIIEIDKKIKVSKPLRLSYGPKTLKLTHQSVVIKVGQFSEVVILEETIAQNKSFSILGETLIFADSESKVEHVKITQGSLDSFEHQSTKVQLKKNAHYHNFIFNLPGAYSRQNLTVNLIEEGSHAESLNLYLAGDKDFSDISTVINHEVADTTSNQLIKGILEGDSKGIFTGKIHIAPKAQRVQSGQLTKNLILSKKAQAFSRPQLEIFADDVKCSHGSTTGQISPEELFYFEARGIPEAKARTLLAFGFGHEIVLKISNPLVKTKVQTLIQKSLETKIHLGEVK